MNTSNFLILIGATIICVIIGLVIKRIVDKRTDAKNHALWETGATRFLGLLWGLNDFEAQNPTLPPSLERAPIFREFTLQRLQRFARDETSIEGTVCGERLEALVEQPNRILIFVEKQETERALHDAYRSMYTPDSAMYVGKIPLELDIRLTAPS